MVAAQDDLDALILAGLSGHPVDKAMFARDAARPPAGEVAFQRLGLAEALEGGSP